ncbi:MAG: hypothetical protein IKG98_05730 [Ruminococcus sp.]|nr:hypothetical protein [Ruminococcus sp.]
MRFFRYKLAGVNAEELIMGEPTVRECDGILSSATNSELIEAVAAYLSRNQQGVIVKEKLIAADIILVKIKLNEWLASIKTSPAYQAPRIEPDSDAEELPYNCTTTHIKAVAEYARMSFLEVYELRITEFWKLFRDAIIWNYSRTEAGIEKLRHAKCMSQTEPDRDSLKESSVIRRVNHAEQED